MPVCRFALLGRGHKDTGARRSHSNGYALIPIADLVFT